MLMIQHFFFCNGFKRFQLNFKATNFIDFTSEYDDFFFAINLKAVFERELIFVHSIFLKIFFQSILIALIGFLLNLKREILEFNFLKEKKKLNKSSDFESL